MIKSSSKLDAKTVVRKWKSYHRLTFVVDGKVTNYVLLGYLTIIHSNLSKSIQRRLYKFDSMIKTQKF